MERLAEAVIVPAGPGDAAGLAAAHVRSWRETYRGLLPDSYLDGMSVPLYARRWRLQLTRARPSGVVLLAEGPDEVLGYCAGAGEEVHTLYIVRSAQKAGLGRRLLIGAARALEGAGARSLKLWVLNGNLSARDFYLHMGGRHHGERPVSGWGGCLAETAYLWDPITKLTG